MRNFKIAAMALLLLAVSASAFANNVKPAATAFSGLPYYSLTNLQAYSVTVRFGVSIDASGYGTLYAYITDTDQTGFVNRVAAPGSVTIYGYITVGSYSTYGQITIPGGETYGTAGLGTIGSTTGVTISSASLSTGTTIGGLPAYINTTVGSLY